MVILAQNSVNSYINFLIEFQVPQIISQVHPLGGPAQTYLMKISCLETSILLNVEAFFFLLLLRLLLLGLFCFSINLSILACESQLHTIFRVVVVRYVEKLPTWPDIVRIKGNKIWYPPEMMVSRPKIYLTYLCIVRIVFYTLSRFGAWTSICNVLVIDIYIQPAYCYSPVSAVSRQVFCSIVMVYTNMDHIIVGIFEI